MKTYKYQMHMHTLPTSACSRADQKTFIEALHNGGYQGGVITNHFKHGNTGIDRSLPWKDFVKAYEDDYLLLKEEAKKYDMDILFGIEQGVGGGLEILCYGITPQLMYDHPELDTPDASVWYNVIHLAGGIVLQAHPFRERDYIKEARIMPEFTDGIEVYNSSNTTKNNLEARLWADEHKDKILISGGDAHDGDVAVRGGIETAVRLKSEEDVIDILKRGAYNLLEN